MQEEIKTEVKPQEQQNMLKLSDILEVCKNFIKSPDDKEILEKYNSMLQSFIIRSYLPMQEKVLVLIRMVIDSDKSVDIEPSFFTAGLELACCFDGLLAYVNLEPEIHSSIKTYENYDLLYQSGVADYILQYCQKDYDRLVNMMERTMSFENLQELTQSMSAMDTGALRDLTNTIKEAQKQLDPKTVKDMADIMRFNDPSLYDLKNSLEDEVFDKLDKMDKLEKLEKKEQDGNPELPN